MKRIPKKLHTYWDGSPMSLLQSFTVTSFHKYNPDWEITIHMPEKKYDGDMKFHFIPDYIGEDYFHTIASLDYVNINIIDLNAYDIRHDIHDILRSDIFRYHVLHHEGGVWSDFDVLWIKPIEHFRNTEYHGDVPADEISAVASFLRGTEDGHSIGIMIHRKHDPYALSLAEGTKTVQPPFGHEVFGGTLLARLYPDLKSLDKFKTVVGARFETYYPFNIHPPVKTIQNLYRGEHLEYINNNVLCVHWYNGHILSKHYINHAFGSPCTMTTILKNEGHI